MEKFSRLNKNVFAGKGLHEAADAAFVCHVAGKALRECFDKSFCKDVCVVALRDQVLYIETPNGSYSQEIRVRESDVLDIINKKAEHIVVKSIRFKPHKST